MTRRSPLLVISALALATGLVACRYQSTPVRLQASAADISALAGRWEGQYTGRQTGRSGSIVFTIQTGKDTAYGDVLMGGNPERMGQPITAADVASGEHARHSSAPELLRVSMVRVMGGSVEGILEPYLAPDCNCTVTTTFRGIVAGNTIKGDYLTTGSYGLRQTGTWSVTRQQQRADIAK
jgi:hypothetical protein